MTAASSPPAPAEPLEGLLVVDKPVGPTSFDVIRALRRVLRTRALGHTGTLDPAASGVLCVAIGWALKLIRFIDHERKVYEATVALGRTTTTDDAEGETLSESPVAGIEAGRLAAALEALTGSIAQRPPAYSAIHVGGERAYARARRGEHTDLAPRTVVVERIEVLWMDLPRLGLRVTCGPGTYVRSLARDLGERLGCGAHLAALRRLANGPFDLARATPLEQLLRAAEAGTLPLVSVSEMLAHLPLLSLAAADLQRLRQGQRVPLAECPGVASGQTVRLVDEAGRLVVVAELRPDGVLQPLRVRPLAR